MIITLFDSVQKAYTTRDKIIDATWDEIADFLTEFNQCDRKEDMLLFNLWDFNPNGEPGRRRIYENQEPTERYEIVPGTIRRCKANARSVSAIVLDYDGETTIDEAVESLIGIEMAAYTTFRHSKEQNKFRIVLPFKEAVTPEKFLTKKHSITETFQKVDHASFSESQSFYLHSGPDKENAIAFRCKGEFLDINWFEDEIIPPKIELPKRDFTGDKNIYRDKMLESLASCKGLHYNGPHKYNVLTLVALCKSAGITFEEYDILCANIAASDSSLKNPNLRKTAWLGWNTQTGVTAKVREDFIASHGGRSTFIKPDNEIRTIMEKYRKKEQ